jgi:cell division protein FtsB
MGPFRSVVLSFGLGAAILYLAAHTVTGRQGLVNYVALQQQERALIAESQALEAMRSALSARTARMKTAALDLDYLEERARVTLDAAAPDEIIFELAPVAEQAPMDRPAARP